MKSQLRKRLCGLTLIELMIALVISLFLIGGVISVSLSNRTNYRFTEATSRLQENGRFALETMAYDIRMAGFFGCAAALPRGAKSNNLNHTSGGSFDFFGNQPLSGTNNDGLNGSDTLSVSGALGEALSVKKVPATTAAALDVPKNNGIQQGDILMVSDCTSTDIFQVTNANPDSGTVGHNTGATATGPGNASQDLQKQYAPGSQVLKAGNVVYALGMGINGEPALFRTENGAPQELIGGVEDMQILHGVDSGSDAMADRFVPADQVTNFARVVSVRVMLLLRSEADGVVDATQTIEFNGATVNPPDRRLRQIYATTVAVRNRIP